jgi:hypothetical protein
MVEPPAGEAETGRDIGKFEIRQLGNDLLGRKSGGQEIKHVAQPVSQRGAAG